MVNFDDLLTKILGNDKKQIKEVLIDYEVIEEIMELANQSYPNEFVALLSGELNKNKLYVDGLMFLPGQTSTHSATIDLFMLPSTTGSIGSVHSHPIPNNIPSDKDSEFFAKSGLVHLIIAYPYNTMDIAVYNTFSEKISYKII